MCPFRQEKILKIILLNLQATKDDRSIERGKGPIAGYRKLGKVGRNDKGEMLGRGTIENSRAIDILNNGRPEKMRGKVLMNIGQTATIEPCELEIIDMATHGDDARRVGRRIQDERIVLETDVANDCRINDIGIDRVQEEDKDREQRSNASGVRGNARQASQAARASSECNMTEGPDHLWQ